MTTRAVAAKSTGNRFTRFFTGIWSEMKKVIWLSRREAFYLTVLVLVVTVITGVILYAFDLGFSSAINHFVIH